MTRYTKAMIANLGVWAVCQGAIGALAVGGTTAGDALAMGVVAVVGVLATVGIVVWVRITDRRVEGGHTA